LLTPSRLALEIAKFYDYAKPSRSEALVRRKVIEQVRTHVREVLPDHVLEVFGSERTGIALATSDIDLRLMSRQDLVDGSGKMPPSKEERRSLLNGLHKLHRSKFQGNRSYLLPTVRHARYPLISLQDRASGLDVQIVLSNDTSLSREYMQQYMQEYPYLRSVYSVIKTMFDARGLSDVFRGGFGSYSLFMMLVASLKHMPSKRNDATGALLNFLHFWGTFDTTKQGVSIEPPILFDKSEELVMRDKVKAQFQVRLQSFRHAYHTNPILVKRPQTPPTLHALPP
jgi:non-canonical poly(A) RNA polymerase PAPD5/7